ncbi:MAG: amidohydrolase family protein, partial [Gemmatimonadales bacterium]|nr:amidohydrolase family protein [Gemmatimonadales bacterium]
MRSLLLATGLLLAGAPAQAQDYDVVIRGGRVLDGSGNPPFPADVGVRGDRIVAVGDLSRAAARRVIDARGRLVTPGFFAMHEHIEPAILGGFGTLPNYTTQGFTTAVIDADGDTEIWPLARQRDTLTRMGSALNLVPLVGHGTVRRLAMGEDFERPATIAEVERMKALVRQGMEEGAFGLSTGLEYVPMRYSTEEEVLELAKVVAPYGGHYQAHLRSQGQHPKWQLPSSDSKPITNIDAVMETISIGRLAGIPVMMDHLHPKGPR